MSGVESRKAARSVDKLGDRAQGAGRQVSQWRRWRARLRSRGRWRERYGDIQFVVRADVGHYGVRTFVGRTEAEANRKRDAYERMREREGR